MYKLIGPDGKEYLSEKKGALGGHKRLKICGRRPIVWIMWRPA